MKKTTRNAGRMAAVALTLALAFLAGTVCEPRTSAGVRQSAPREAFLSGGERSVPLLVEISATLKRIDNRLARLEKLMAADGKR